MSSFNAKMHVLNNTGQDLTGWVAHLSGSNPDLETQIDLDNLPNGVLSQPTGINVRSDHHDYFQYSLVVNGKQEEGRLRNGVHAPGSNVFVVVSAKGVVVITQNNGWDTATY